MSVAEPPRITRPLYHDMGLIGAWLGSLCVGFPLVVMSPLAFLARPLRWLEAIAQWRGTLTAAPNFAYELCLKYAGAGTLEGLDLRSLRVAFNGAEAVSVETLRRFTERFAPCGLRPEAIAPVYGLAEASVGLLFPPLGRTPPVDAVQREPFTREGRAIPAAPDHASPLRFVGCGRPLAGHEVRIVDAEGRELGERMEGRLEFRGPSATRGYFRDPQKTAQLIRDGWLDTGDRAYAAGTDIYITGRVKDIVIRGGRHFHPEEIEEAVGRLPGIRKGCVAVFGSADAISGTERMVVLAEVRPATGILPAQQREAIARAVVATVGEPPDDVVLASPHTVLKTSSGKVRRSACRELYEHVGTVFAPAPLYRQLLRLALGSAATRLKAAASTVGGLLFAGYAWTLFALLAPLVWLVIRLMPKPAEAWAVAHAAAGTMFRLTGTTLRVEGLDRLPCGPCMLVCNHGSYLDGIILMAALPQRHLFVAKRELAAQPAVGSLLGKIGTLFVERFEAKHAVEAADAMAQALARGESLVVFPEGTFVAQAGMMPFHLGAFIAAARAATPVVPLAIRGNRQALPDGSWRPRRAVLQVEICTPVMPSSNTADLFARAIELRDAASQMIASRVEPA